MRDIQAMRTAVRDFFIDTYNDMTHVMDFNTSHDRSQRYQERQKHYMELVEKNDCGCFNTVEDIQKAMLMHQELDYWYIKEGVKDGRPRNSD